LVHGEIWGRELHKKCKIPGDILSDEGAKNRKDSNGECLALARLPYMVYTLGVAGKRPLTCIKRKWQTCSDVRAQSRESRENQGLSGCRENFKTPV